MMTTTEIEAMVGKIFDVTGLAKRHNGRYVVKSYNAAVNWYVLARLGKNGQERTGVSPAAHDTNSKIWSPAQIAEKIAAGIMTEVK